MAQLKVIHHCFNKSCDDPDSRKRHFDIPAMRTYTWESGYSH